MVLRSAIFRASRGFKGSCLTLHSGVFKDVCFYIPCVLLYVGFDFFKGTCGIAVSATTRYGVNTDVIPLDIHPCMFSPPQYPVWEPVFLNDSAMHSG